VTVFNVTSAELLPTASSALEAPEHPPAVAAIPSTKAARPNAKPNERFEFDSDMESPFMRLFRKLRHSPCAARCRDLRNARAAAHSARIRGDKRRFLAESPAFPSDKKFARVQVVVIR